VLIQLVEGHTALGKPEVQPIHRLELGTTSYLEVLEFEALPGLRSAGPGIRSRRRRGQPGGGHSGEANREPGGGGKVVTRLA